MKQGIHPDVHQKAKTTCSTCSTVYEIPSTIAEQTVETCRTCHPVYTGKTQTERRGGRIDRWKRMTEAAKAKKGE